MPVLCTNLKLQSLPMFNVPATPNNPRTQLDDNNENQYKYMCHISASLNINPNYKRRLDNNMNMLPLKTEW
jgi:hypothetical protein